MSPSLFQVLCYLALSTSRSGWEEVFPSYLDEKLYILAPGLEEAAFAALDMRNQRRVIDYCRRFNVPIPPIVKSYMKDATEVLGFDPFGS